MSVAIETKVFDLHWRPRAAQKPGDAQTEEQAWFLPGQKFAGWDHAPSLTHDQAAAASENPFVIKALAGMCDLLGHHKSLEMPGRETVMMVAYDINPAVSTAACVIAQCIPGTPLQYYSGSRGWLWAEAMLGYYVWFYQNDVWRIWNAAGRFTLDRLAYVSLPEEYRQHFGDERNDSCASRYCLLIQDVQASENGPSLRMRNGGWRFTACA